MKANELRIGNYALRKEYLFENKNYHEIIIDHNDITACVIKPEDFKPITITEELLLKFGFENGIDEMTFYNNLICIYWKKFDNYFEINGENYFITELHMFQNLYWALCGEELTIKN